MNLIDARGFQAPPLSLALPAGPFDMIMADPAWRFASNSAAKPGKNPLSKYRCMTMAEIKAMPIADIAAPDCLLWLWATAPMFHLQLEVVGSWGFKYSTSGVWVKRTKHGKLSFGTGFRLRNSHEPFIIATRGKPKTTRAVRSVVEGLLRKHSQKPEEAFAMAEAMMPGDHVRRLELFSRTDRPGWESWGDEAGTIPAEPVA